MTEDRLAGPARSGERKLVTLLFADLSGYTALVASMDPEEAYAFVRPGMRMTPNGPCGRASPSGTTLASCAAAGPAPHSPRSTRASRPAR